jgi:hypothetical protein
MGKSKEKAATGRAQGWTPGPGKYNLDSKKANGVTFTKSLRDGPRQAETTPGPGEYTVVQGQHKGAVKKGITMGSRPVSAATENRSPGPQTYNVEQPRPYEKKQVVQSIGKAEREDLCKGSSVRAGPGSYDISKNIFAPAPITIPKAPRGSMISDEGGPGPGQYEYRPLTAQKSVTDKSTFGKAPGKSLVTVNTPGPGQYNLEVGGKQKQGCTIGKSQRNSAQDKIVVPGPGNYNIATDSLVRKVASSHKQISKPMSANSNKWRQSE